MSNFSHLPPLRRERARGGSVASSRHSTPLPSHMRDQDMVDDPYGGTAYVSGLSYDDMDLGAGSSRPAPVPYDDPYSDSYDVAPPEVRPNDGTPLDPSADNSQRGHGRVRGGPGRDHHQRPVEGGRGRGRGRRNNERGRGRGRGRGVDRRGAPPQALSDEHGAPMDEYNPHYPRPPSPTSLAIARATGQYSESLQTTPHVAGGGGWGYPQFSGQPFNFPFPYQYPQVQPHINPRFAANFGMMGMGMGYSPHGSQSAPYSQDASGYAVGGNGGSGWAQEWGTGSQTPSGQFSGDDNP